MFHLLSRKVGITIPLPGLISVYIQLTGSLNKEPLYLKIQLQILFQTRTHNHLWNKIENRRNCLATSLVPCWFSIWCGKCALTYHFYIGMLLWEQRLVWKCHQPNASFPSERLFDLAQIYQQWRRMLRQAKHQIHL